MPLARRRFDQKESLRQAALTAGTTEQTTEIDEKRGRYVNDNLAEYLIAVNADVPNVEVIMVPEEDNEINPLGVKGIGELGIVGTAAAIANAVYHATGKRVRNLPIVMDKLLA